jgi:hypothetical protein
LKGNAELFGKSFLAHAQHLPFDAHPTIDISIGTVGPLGRRAAKTLYNRFVRWAAKGVWSEFFMLWRQPAARRRRS